MSDRGGRPSPVALLAPGMVAVAGGLLAARVLVRVARRRAARAAGPWPGRGRCRLGGRRPPARHRTDRLGPGGRDLPAASSVSRPGPWRSATGYERAAAETGAEVVLQVRAPSHRALLDAVRAADRDGQLCDGRRAGDDEQPGGGAARRRLDPGRPHHRVGSARRGAARPGVRGAAATDARLDPARRRSPRRGCRPAVARVTDAAAPDGRRGSTAARSSGSTSDTCDEARTPTARTCRRPAPRSSAGWRRWPSTTPAPTSRAPPPTWW